MSQVLLPLFDLDGARVPDFFFDEKSKVIYFLKSIEGKKVKFSTQVRLPDIAKAKRIANKKLRNVLGRNKARITPLIKDMLDPWTRVKESEGLDPATLRKIEDAKKRIEPFWGDKFPYEINRDTLAEWYKWLDEKYPGQQKENPIKYMRNFCRYLAECVHNGVPLLPAVPKISDPNKKDVTARRKKKKQLIFSAEDFKKIYDAGDEREKLIALFMYTMATRIDETLKLRFGREILMDEDPPLYRWTIGQNKADHWGQHALHPALIEPLMLLRERRNREGTCYLFPQDRDNKKPIRAQMIAWKSWRERADIGWHWTSHTFRHTCLSNLFNDERNPQALILKLYRVSLPVALETYIKPTKSGIEKMRTAIEVKL